MSAPDETSDSIPPQLTQTQNDLYVALGVAITAWQEVEVALFEIYGRFMWGADQAIVSAAFHSTVNFSVKLDATNAAACMALHETPALTIWETFYGRLNRRAKVRNKIAHFHLYKEENPSNSSRELFLGPNWQDTRKEWMFDVKQHSDKFYIKEIREAAESFYNLKLDLDHFLGKLPPLPRRRTTFQKRLHDWIRSLVEADQSRQEPQAPPEPLQPKLDKQPRGPKLSSAQKRKAREAGGGQPA